jgi:hypothetical protein
MENSIPTIADIKIFTQIGYDCTVPPFLEKCTIAIVFGHT